MRQVRLLLAAACLAIVAPGQLTHAQTPAVTPPSCPNPTKMKNICLAVDSMNTNKPVYFTYQYRYQKMILDGACVDPARDTESDIRRKIGDLWRHVYAQPRGSPQRSALSCTNFEVSNGSLLKFAVSIKADWFLSDIVRWSVPLNEIDESDGKTVLDYVADQKRKNAGNAVEYEMKLYYDQLRQAGAKHASELLGDTK